MTGAPALRPSVPPEAATRHFDTVLRPDLAGVYATRATRLRALSDGHDLADYLRLAALVTDAQAACLDAAPTASTTDPLGMARHGGWTAVLDRLIAHLAPAAPDAVADHLSRVQDMTDSDRRTAGAALMLGDFASVDPAIAPFLWAALSVSVARTARALPLPATGPEESADCSICGTAPAASVIHTGAMQGLRYLHCALCDCEWHRVRAKCSDCGDGMHLDYLSFDTPEAAIRAESCGACGGYLKVISLERDPNAEVIADDLATLLLDEAATAEGFARSGFNPFALPG